MNNKVTGGLEETTIHPDALISCKAFLLLQKRLVNKIKLHNRAVARYEGFHINETGKVIVKGEFGASASTTYVLNHVNSNVIREISHCIQLGDRYLVESYYNSISQPSSVWFISKDKRIVHLRTSNQLLDEETSHI